LAPNPLKMKEERLALLNQVVLPLLRAARRYSASWRILLPSTAGTSRLEGTKDYTATVLQLNLPASNPMLIAIYISVQKSSPLTPSQLEPKIRKLKELVNKLRGKTFVAADIIYIIIAPKGYTIGSRRIAKKNGVNAVKTVEEAVARLRIYIRTRLQKLVEKVRGKRIWGELPLLIYALQSILEELGEKLQTFFPEDLIVKIALEGGSIV
jgi:hypothetical protein